MGIDRATDDDDTPAPATEGNTDRNAERTARQQAGPDDGHTVQRAETRPLEEYADAMRAGGGPMSRDSSQDNRESPEEENYDVHLPCLSEQK
jgi:hypothetical protein